MFVVKTVGGFEYQWRQQEEEEEFWRELREDEIVVVDADLRHGTLLVRDGVDEASE